MEEAVGIGERRRRLLVAARECRAQCRHEHGARARRGRGSVELLRQRRHGMAAQVKGGGAQVQG